MAHVFDPMGPGEKRAFLAAYLEHLKRRNGAIDPARRRSAARDAFFRSIIEAVRPVCSVVAQETFDRNNRSGRVDATLDDETLWALTTAKANLSERYAIERQLAISTARDVDPDDPQSYIDIEEFYHTRILADALSTIGLSVSFAAPPLATRLLIAVMIKLPRSIANVVILAAEIGGVVLFRLLLERARALFSCEPKALARIELLFAQILADEIGHVLYVRSRLGPIGLFLARLALPVVAWLYRHDVREIDRLFGPTALLEGMRRVDIPELWRIHPDRSAAQRIFAASAGALAS